ncbi:recombinase family protein [Anaerobacillus sp. HL2]|nr:recombinase family protein [Anaerobacillus sp. HL2]
MSRFHRSSRAAIIPENTGRILYVSDLEEPELSICRIYADEGISGRFDEKSREVNRLIQVVSEIGSMLIYVKSISRLSRDIKDTLEITRYLQTAFKSSTSILNVKIFGLRTASRFDVIDFWRSIAQEESMKRYGKVHGVGNSKQSQAWRS